MYHFSQDRTLSSTVDIRITEDDRKEMKEMSNHLRKGVQETRDSEDKWKKGPKKSREQLARKGLMMIGEETDFSLRIIRKKLSNIKWYDKLLRIGL